jgi:hypothetical protein
MHEMDEKKLAYIGNFFKLNASEKKRFSLGKKKRNGNPNYVCV